MDISERLSAYNWPAWRAGRGGDRGGREGGGFRMCLEVRLTGLGTGLHGAQEESSFLSWAAGDEGLSLCHRPLGFWFMFTPPPPNPSGGT